MPLEILTGADVPALLKRAQKRLGEDAVVLSVRRIADGGSAAFELTAADPVTAERQRSTAPGAPRGADVLIADETPRPRVALAAAPPARAARAAHPDDADFWRLDREPEVVAPARVKLMRRGPWPFRLAPAAERVARRPRVVALVGPTGAGKTTTLAKLANHPHGFAGRRTGLLCLDTYRIGGVEQARQYADLSRLPFEVVWEARDISRAMHRLRDCEVVLVDTPGRGPRAAGDLKEIQSRLLELFADEVHLVLPAGLQPALARRLLMSHLPLGVTHVLATKLDEYPDERGLFELARQFALPMRWVTDGQEVPRDLQLAPGSPAARPGVALEAA